MINTKFFKLGLFFISSCAFARVQVQVQVSSKNYEPCGDFISDHIFIIDESASIKRELVDEYNQDRMKIATKWTSIDDETAVVEVCIHFKKDGDEYEKIQQPVLVVRYGNPASTEMSTLRDGHKVNFFNIQVQADKI